jgi:tetratricopeptide (TPR) repeat protein
VKPVFAILIGGAVLANGTGSIQAADVSSGSGVIVGVHGEVLTNAHVVKDCIQITVRSSSVISDLARLVASDETNDLAVVRTKAVLPSIAAFRDAAPVRAGDAVVVLGYPLAGLLAKQANLTVGNVSALAGLGDDSRYLQISAPVQPGNSGGPLLDASGHLVGIVSAKLNAVRVARFTGDIPENVNFAIKADVARAFLDSRRIAYQTARSEEKLSPADVGDIARPFTVQIECEESGTQSAAASPTQSPPQSTNIEPTQQELENWCNSSEVSPDLTIRGCTAVLQFGASASTFNKRAQAYYSKHEYDQAITDFTKAIKLEPSSATFRFRGRAYSAKGDYNRAFADWTQSVELVRTPGATAYWLLWSYLASARMGKIETSDLAAGTPLTHLISGDWPKPIIEFYLGQRSDREMMSAATNPDELCEAHFYLGEWYLVHDSRAAAIPELRIAASTCVKDFYEYDGAVAELRRLERK